MAAVSLGCAKNRIDTEEIMGHLLGNGCLLTGNTKSADVVIINTCAFIEAAQQESVDTILRTARLRRGGRRPLVIAAGCLVERYGRALLEVLPELDGALGVHSYRYTAALLALCRNGKRAALLKPPSTALQAVAGRVLTTPPHSVYVRIAEGCDNRCRYCLIPSLRGPFRSRAGEEIIAEVRELVQRGAGEVNLIAQDTTAYGMDRDGKPALPELLRELVLIPGNFRIRILYTHPSHITEELIEVMAAERKICRYIDLPLQHINSDILQSMGRPYNREKVTALIDELRLRIPGIALRTTFLVGYPGESRDDFEELLEFISTFSLERVGVYAYSPQRGTPASVLPGLPPRRVREKRRREMMIAQQKTSLHLNRKLNGSRITVLVDRVPVKTGGYYSGRTEHQAPEVDGEVYFKSSREFTAGSLVSVKVATVSPYSLLGITPRLLQ